MRKGRPRPYGLGNEMEHQMLKKKKKVIVIGGGITGLSAAHRMKCEEAERGIALDVTLLEASDSIGGVIQTEDRDGFIVEHGPDAFITSKPWGKALCEELGISEKMIGTNPKVRRSFVVRKGRLLPVPEGFYMMAPGSFGPFIKSPIFSLSGKLRIALDLFLPRRSGIDDESVADFVRRRLGKQAFERMAQPMIGGIYTSDAENLSLNATFPRFVEMEEEHGSIIKALLVQKRNARQTSRGTSGARYSLFQSFTTGMQTLTDTLAERLSDCIQLQKRVTTIQQDENGVGWIVRLDDGGKLETDLICIALPAHQSAKLISTVSPALVDKLNSVPYKSSVTVNLAFRREDVMHPLNGMGFVVPITEGSNIVGCSFSSVKFENRAPVDQVLLRAFVGENAKIVNEEMNDTKLVTTVLKEVTDLLGIRNEPIFSVVSQHRKAMAQYLVGHKQIIDEIDSLVKDFPGLALAGNAYHGVGIPDCINSGQQAALKLISEL